MPSSPPSDDLPGGATRAGAREAPLVTLAVPVYRRLDSLPRALRSVRAQDYGRIDLLVSDNGGNGTEVREIVESVYGRGYRFRRNDRSVPVIRHFNQLIEEARGEYFVLLCDDDVISPDFVSSLVEVMERDPSVSVAIARQEAVDREGNVLTASEPRLPERMAGPDFIRLWCGGTHGFRCFVTNLARTEQLRSCGMFPDFERGYHSDDALIVKLCLLGDVAVVSRAVFRWQVEESSLAWSAGYRDLVRSSRQFSLFLKEDPVVLRFASQHAEEWREIRALLSRMNWKTYLSRWKRMRDSGARKKDLMAAAFAYPWDPGYCRALLGIFLRSASGRCRRLLAGRGRGAS